MIDKETREVLKSILFIRKNGGLEAVKSRLMPEGMEWPRFEDGEPVRIGDELEHKEQGHRFTVDAIEFMGDGWRACYEKNAVRDVYRPGERVKRPAPEVLDADGAEIRAGDMVYDIDDWHAYPHTVVSTELDGLGHVKTTCEMPNPASVSIHPSRLTHERPDSWERWRNEWQWPPCDYCKRVLGVEYDHDTQLQEAFDAQGKDLERRAKRLAGVE